MDTCDGDRLRARCLLRFVCALVLVTVPLEAWHRASAGCKRGAPAATSGAAEVHTSVWPNRGDAGGLLPAPVTTATAPAATLPATAPALAASALLCELLDGSRIGRHRLF